MTDNTLRSTDHAAAPRSGQADLQDVWPARRCTHLIFFVCPFFPLASQATGANIADLEEVSTDGYAYCNVVDPQDTSIFTCAFASGILDDIATTPIVAAKCRAYNVEVFEKTCPTLIEVVNTP